MSVKGSQNYVWFLAERIGRGAMGNVYVARNRKKGTKFAAKVFSQTTKMMPKDYVTVEIEILRYLPRHSNIIKFEAVEEETYSHDKVLIMELCEGGSVQTLLDRPENYYGFSEEELMLIFEHICAALHHLFRHQVIHRDIKPGNILLYIALDGRHVYKLIDFGASKRLDVDDKGFKSLCGTEEYLHPKMYQAAFIRRIPGQVYDHSVDLWSFGVTLYQCATGKLPFSPKAGIRQDKHMMHMLITEREPDVISQVESSDGTIKKRSELPFTSRLSSGVREKLTKVLRSLLNVSQTVDPSRFFAETESIFKYLKVHVFSLETRAVLTVFVNVNDNLTRLKEAIGKQTGISPDEQVLLARDGLLSESVHFSLDPPNNLRDMAKTSMEDPIFVLAKSSPRNAKEYQPVLPEVAQYEAGMNLSADGKFAKETCGNICYYQRLIQRCRLVQGHMTDTEKSLRLSLSRICQKIEPVLLSLKTMLKIALLAADHCQFLSASNGRLSTDSLNEQKTRIAKDNTSLKTTEEKFSNLVADVTTQLQQTSQSLCVTPARCVEKAAKILADSMPMYESLKADVSKELGHNDAEIHKYMRSEIKHACRRIKEIAENHCLKQEEQKYRQAKSNIRKMLEIQHALLRLNQDVDLMNRNVVGFEQSLAHRDHTQCQTYEGRESSNAESQFSELSLQSSGDFGAGGKTIESQPIMACVPAISCPTPKETTRGNDSEMIGVQPREESAEEKFLWTQDRYGVEEISTDSSSRYAPSPLSSQIPLLSAEDRKQYGLDNSAFESGSEFDSFPKSVQATLQSPRRGRNLPGGARPRTGFMVNSSQSAERQIEQFEPQGMVPESLYQNIRHINHNMHNMTQELQKNNQYLLRYSLDDG